MTDDYLKRISFNGDSRRAMAGAAAALKSVGFTVISADESRVDATSRGGLPNKTRQGLRVFSGFRVRATAGGIEITGALSRFHAELSGVKALTFTVLIIATIVMSVQWATTREPKLLIVAAAAASMAAVSPYGWRAGEAFMRAKAFRAADALAQSVVAAGR